MYRRLRDEAPLYYNEQLRLLRVSRFDDVERGARRPGAFSSAEGDILELIKADIEMPPGVVIFEDPPSTRRPPRPAVAGVHARSR